MGHAARIRGVDGHCQRRLASPTASRGGAGAGERRCVGRNGIVGRRQGDQVLPPLEFDRRTEAGRSLKTGLPTKKSRRGTSSLQSSTGPTVIASEAKQSQIGR